MRIAITGATGFIGSNLMMDYLKKGHEVVAIVPDPENIDPNAYKFEKLSVIKASFEEFCGLVNNQSFSDIDILYYLAWSGYGKSTNDYSEQIKNIKPLCDAVLEASKIGCGRFVFASSFSEYMISERQCKTHNDGAFCNVYGSTKHAARIIAQSVAAQNSIQFISVAFANTFGPGDRSKRSTNLFIHKILLEQPIDLTEGIHLYDWNYIDDTIAGLELAGELGKTDSVYYIGSNERRPLKDIVSDVRDIINPKAKICFGTYKEDFYVDYSSVDVHKLYRETGYLAKTDFKEAILKTVEWVKSLGW